ncbi:hypothetical protein HNO89_003150 [Sporosarcina luteola]|nr:hypothetical protein [Sporosarcina luteola]
MRNLRGKQQKHWDLKSVNRRTGLSNKYVCTGSDDGSLVANYYSDGTVKQVRHQAINR